MDHRGVHNETTTYERYGRRHQQNAGNNPAERRRDPICDKLKLQFAINIMTSKYATAWRDYLNLGRFDDQPVSCARKKDQDSDFEHSLVAQCLNLKDRRQRERMTPTQWAKGKNSFWTPIGHRFDSNQREERNYHESTGMDTTNANSSC